MISKNLLKFAAENYGFEKATLERIPRSSGKIMNEIYTFYKNGRKYIIKFEPPSEVYKNQLRETRAALDFHCYLSDCGVNVSAPLKNIHGEPVTSALDGGTEYIITAFAWLNGQTWGYDGANGKMSYNWGKTMGAMHCAAKSYTPPNEYDVQKDIFDGFYWGRFFDGLKIYPDVYKIAQKLFREITALPRDADSFGVIHGDLHQGNFFTDGENIRIIDFGDSIYGWYTLDAAISLCHALWWGRMDDDGNDHTDAIVENFMKGYFSANPLSEFWLSKIPLFMKYRHLCMVPEENGIGCDRDGWIYNIKNDILFEGRDLKSISDVIKKSTAGCKYEATLKSALDYAGQNNIEEWVHEYLCGEGDNRGFSDGLKLEKREYTGPILMDLDLFTKTYGPEPGLKYSIREDDKEQIKWFWFNTGGIHEKYRAGNWDMPPLIVNDDGGVYELNDGNHRLEALKMLGVKEYWVIFWKAL